MSLPPIDETHDAQRRSWVPSANGHPDFPIQNLPWCRFSVAGSAPRVGVAIGDSLVHLERLAATGLLEGPALQAARDACGPAANGLLALAPESRRALRRALSDLLATTGRKAAAAQKDSAHFLLDASDCTLQLPADIGHYTDFNAGIHHAANGGRRRGLKDPVLPNYRHLPVAYHSRASSVRASGFGVRRPWGQFLPEGSDQPVFEPTRKLDFEFELGIWIGRGNELGEPVPITDAADHIAGYCLLNDWSSRDLQSWESQRLGPFLGKNFCTTISPWIVTPEALAPFRGPPLERAPEEPKPMPHLADAEDAREGMPQLHLEVWLAKAGESEARRISAPHSRYLYWTPAQMVAHHTSNGCNLEPGDLFGSGTVTGLAPDEFGTLLDAPTPRFLEDGDRLVMKAHARREGFVTIGFGDCEGTILPARNHHA